MKAHYLVSAAVLAGLVTAGVVWGQETPPVPTAAYVGVQTCGMCHKSEKQGSQLSVWKASKHAKAFETLKTPEAKATAEKAGLKTPAHESPECLKCHASGWGLTAEQRETYFKGKFKMEEGVQCETCHGAGDKYKAMSVMKNREEAIKNGMIVGDEQLCLTCHNDKAPSWNPERFTTKDGRKVGFDYTTAWEQIKHPVPK